MQQQDVQELKGLLGGHSSKSGSEHKRDSDDGIIDHSMMQGMDALRNAKGNSFDRAFVDEMTKHHQMGLEMAQMALQKASSAEVKNFAQKTVDVQGKEIEELKSLTP